MIDYILFVLWRWKRNRLVKKARKREVSAGKDDFISYCEKDAALTLEMYERTREDRWER